MYTVSHIPLQELLFICENTVYNFLCLTCYVCAYFPKMFLDQHGDLTLRTIWRNKVSNFFLRQEEKLLMCPKEAYKSYQKGLPQQIFLKLTLHFSRYIY